MKTIRRGLKFTRAELNHLLHLLARARDTGIYYGPVGEYRKRADRVEKKLDAAYMALRAEPKEEE